MPQYTGDDIRDQLLHLNRTSVNMRPPLVIATANGSYYRNVQLQRMQLSSQFRQGGYAAIHAIGRVIGHIGVLSLYWSIGNEPISDFRGHNFENVFGAELITEIRFR